MKKSILLFIGISIAVIASAQYNTDTYLNAGIGLSNWGIPVYLSYEKPIAQDINIGGGISASSVARKYNNGAGKIVYRHTAVGLEGFGSYYFDRVLDIPSEFDVYAGLGLGFVFWNTKLTDGPNGFDEKYSGSAATSGLNLRGFVGARYHFNAKTSVNLELGGGNVFSGGRVGLSWAL